MFPHVRTEATQGTIQRRPCTAWGDISGDCSGLIILGETDVTMTVSLRVLQRCISRFCRQFNFSSILFITVPVPPCEYQQEK